MLEERCDLNKRELVKEFAHKHRYFTLKEVVKASGASNQLTKNYLQELKQAGIVFSAGKGFYSSVAKEFRLTEKSRVVKIRQLLKKQLPYLDFLAWNTLYFQPYHHHQQTHNITFVEVELDAIRSVADMISHEYRSVLIEKAGRAAPKNFDITHNPIVVRRLIKRLSYQGHVPTLEKMLVDLFVIKNKYSTMQDSDYWDLWRSIDKLFRVNIGNLISYARARRYFRDMLLQLNDNIGFNNVTFGAYMKYAAEVMSKKNIHD